MHKTEAHRLKTDRTPGSRQRASFKAQGNRVKTDRVVMPSDLPAPKVSKKKKTKRRKQ